MTTQTPDSKPRALIAMSGGVDSSVAAWLMQQAGYDCTGITMRLTRNETLGQSGFHTCCSEKDIEDAAEVAFAMDIPYEVLDFTADFREQIIEKFVRVYEAGGTPNPCIDCNKYMKFRHLLDWARAHGMEYVVTGHYARVEQDEATGRFLLKKGLDEGKDQSYVLYNLTQEQLAHIRLPLGGLHKTEVREIAEQHKFVNAHKHDSQDICFVPDGDYARFMEDFTGKHYPAGDFLDESGRVVGTHNARFGTPSASARGWALPWGHLCTSAARTCSKHRHGRAGGDAVRPHRVRGRGELDRHSGADRAAAGHSPHPVPSGGAGRHRLPGGVRLPAGI